MKKALQLILSVFLAVTLVITSSCNSIPVQGQGSSQPSSSGKEIVGYPTYTGNNAQTWTPLYLTTSEMRKQGFFGGLGDNTKTCIEILSTTPDTLLVATADAGILRSSNAGNLWQGTNVGLNSIGADALACDPNNSDFVIAVSTSSSAYKTNGIYLSSSAGISWTLSDFDISAFGGKPQIVFDKSSYNAQNKSSSVIYIAFTDASNTDGVLLRSDDSGHSFKTVKQPSGSAVIAVHPTKSYVYLSDDSGFYRSINRGFSFEKLYDKPVNGVYVSQASPDSVFLLLNDGILVSRDCGESFEENPAALPSGRVLGISVSPLNCRTILAYCSDNARGVRLFFSDDEGESWNESTVSLNNFKMSENSDTSTFAWSYSNPNVVYALINNAVFKSTDTGATFFWSGNGDAGFDMQSEVSQNIHHPEYMSFAISESSIAFTADSGSVWSIKKYADYNNRLSIKAVYMISRSKLIAIMQNTVNGEYEIRTSDNGGEYFNPTDIICKENAYFYSDPGDRNIIFASNLRSTDAGDSWSEMQDCDYVLTHNPVSPNELFGVKGKSIVVSYNRGGSWNRLVNVGVRVCDLSYDYLQRALYIATGEQLLKYYIDENKIENCTDSVFSNQLGETVISHVRSDPMYPNVVYASGCGNGYINNSSVIISEDSGKSWYIISSTIANDSLFSTCQGGLQPVDMVMSANRELIVFSAKFGIHKLGKYIAE